MPREQAFGGEKTFGGEKALRGERALREEKAFPGQTSSSDWTRPGERTFLVERYIPRLRPDDIELLARRLAAAAEELRVEGHDIRWLRSVALPGDETCLCSFSAAARAEVEELNRRAGAGYERILDAVTIEPGAAAQTEARTGPGHAHDRRPAQPK